MEIKVNENCNKLKVPFRLMINGPSESGKSELILNILRHKDVLFEKPIDKIVLSIPSGTQSLFAHFAARIGELHPWVEVINGFSTIYEHIPESKRALLIVEDQGEAIANSALFMNLMVLNRCVSLT